MIITHDEALKHTQIMHSHRLHLHDLRIIARLLFYIIPLSLSLLLWFLVAQNILHNNKDRMRVCWRFIALRGYGRPCRMALSRNRKNCSVLNLNVIYEGRTLNVFIPLQPDRYTYTHTWTIDQWIQPRNSISSLLCVVMGVKNQNANTKENLLLAKQLRRMWASEKKSGTEIIKRRWYDGEHDVIATDTMPRTTSRIHN